ncbi:hypothetical protein TrCOL_g8200 [Triparma columacea]|uniref:Uncharacterized protein n=1 Tax=Triparma columacea TaxID=722753 RepID=A0A9W7GBU8_9STRA|nr:hypothetical protein TrCOL_g8200 [Triparma columacea]
MSETSPSQPSTPADLASTVADEAPPPPAAWLRPAALLLSDAVSYIASQITGPASPPPPHLEPLMNFLKAQGPTKNIIKPSDPTLVDEETTVDVVTERPLLDASKYSINDRTKRRRSSVSIGSQVEMVEREFTVGDKNSSQVAPFGDEASYSERITPNVSASVTEKVIGEYSTVPTSTIVVFEPKLEGGMLKDGVVLKDLVRNTRGLGSFVEGFLQPIGAFLTFIPAPLLPLWGPFAIAGLTNTSLGDGTESITKASVVILMLSGIGGSVFCCIMAMDYHVGTFSLIIRNAKLTILLNIGSRLVYTVAAIIHYPHAANVCCLVGQLITTVNYSFMDALKVTQMMRFTEEGYKAAFGSAIAGFLNFCVFVFNFIFELCRHFAILKLMSDSDEVNVVAVLPARLFGSELVITNLNLMNVTFTTSMVLYLRSILLTFSTGGKRFVVLNTPINFKAVYRPTALPIIGDEDPPPDGIGDENREDPQPDGISDEDPPGEDPQPEE